MTQGQVVSGNPSTFGYIKRIGGRFVISLLVDEDIEGSPVLLWKLDASPRGLRKGEQKKEISKEKSKQNEVLRSSSSLPPRRHSCPRRPST